MRTARRWRRGLVSSYRAWKAGRRERNAPAVVCHHLGGVTSRKIFSPVPLRSFVRQSEFLIVWKDITDLGLVADHVAMLTGQPATAALHRDWPTLVGLAHAVTRLPAVARSRRRAQAWHRLPDREVLRRVSADAIDRSAVVVDPTVTP